MNDAPLVWALLAPLLGGTLSALFLVVAARRTAYRQALEGLALLSPAGGLFAQAALVALSQGKTIKLDLLDLTLSVPPLALLGTISVDAALLCALAAIHPNIRHLAVTSLTASLLVGALLVTDRTVGVILLLAAALGAAVDVVPAPQLLTGEESDNTLTNTAKRLAGGWKYISVAIVGTGLLMAGLLMLARYPFNMEKIGTLQAGLGLLSVGLVVRVGIMPFSAGLSDLVEAAPQRAIVIFGAITPTVLFLGMLILSPIENSLTALSEAGRTAALGLGPLGAVLAGLRAMAGRGQWVESSGQKSEGRNQKELTTHNSQLATHVASSIGLQAAWALFGALSGTHEGMIGAALLAANMALAVPLLLARNRWAGTAIGAASLLGLPPLGGFVGTLMVAQAAANVGGIWLAGLALGSVLTAGAWVSSKSQVPSPKSQVYINDLGQPLSSRVLIWVLIAAQLALFAMSVPIANGL